MQCTGHFLRSSFTLFRSTTQLCWRKPFVHSRITFCNRVEDSEDEDFLDKIFSATEETDFVVGKKTQASKAKSFPKNAFPLSMFDEKKLKEPTEPTGKPGDEKTASVTKREASPIDGEFLEVKEKFIRGWGKGGQKVNKTNNAVFLQETKYNITIKCHETRSREQNRKIARRILKEKVLEAHKIQTKEQRKVVKIQRRKSKQKKRSKLKYSDQVRADNV